jgi:hypothetical protein
MLHELELLRCGINDACTLAASANQQHGSTPPSLLPSPPLLSSQQAQVHFEDGRRLCALNPKPSNPMPPTRLQVRCRLFRPSKRPVERGGGAEAPSGAR